MLYILKKTISQLGILKKYNKVREGLKRYVYQYFIDNNFNKNFNKNIIAIIFNILTLTAALTITNSNFFYNNYGIKYFITLNRLILIKIAKNIVISINNNTFIYNLTSSTEPSSTEPSGIKSSIVRRSNIGNKSSNNKGKSATYFYNNNNNNNNNPPNLLKFIIDINLDELVNIKNLTINIDFLNCYFNNNR